VLYYAHIAVGGAGIEDCRRKTAGRTHGAAGERYSRIFSEKDVERHLSALGRLSPSILWRFFLIREGTGPWTARSWPLTIPPSFSLITGILAGMGFNIFSEKYSPTRKPQIVPRGNGMTRRTFGRGAESSIISPARGHAIPLDIWSEELRSRMEASIRLLEKGDEPSLRRRSSRSMSLW